MKENESKSRSIMGFSLHYPFQRGWKLVLKGGLIAVLGILVLPIFVLYGYFVHVIVNAAAEEELPPLQNLGKLFWEGLKLFVVLIPYGAVLTLGGVGPVILFEGNQVAMLSGLAFYSLFGYVGIMLVSTYAVSGDWRRAYDPYLLYRRTFNWTYLRKFLLFILFYIGVYLAVIIISLISAITIVGPLIVIPVSSFYMVVALAAFMGRMYADITEKTG